jgi:anti-sigma B factor antagonist
MTLATVSISTSQDTPVAQITGEVDASNARELTRRLTAAVPNTAMGMVLDLTRTTYLDSSGVQMLFEVADGLRRRQQELRLVVAAESFIADVLVAVDVGDTAKCDETVADALAALRAG